MSKPRWRRRKDDRPGEITAAALAAFAKNGFAATRIEDVAAAAGVSKGTVYLYFRSKEELFKAVIRENLVPNLAFAERRLEGGEATATELLSEFLRRVAKLVADTDLGAIPKLLIAEAGSFPDLAEFYAREVASRGVTLIEALLRRGAAAGEFREVDARTATPALMAPILMLSLWKTVMEPHLDWKTGAESFVDSYLDIVLNGLRAESISEP
ncbi:MAG: TetR/AcrR family transcriptional regulator [Proteobacteria bacterium]|nr:TetR/AcrR family transcriptional regulator [Pseudomonadota bacterium]